MNILQMIILDLTYSSLWIVVPLAVLFFASWIYDSVRERRKKEKPKNQTN